MRCWSCMQDEFDVPSFEIGDHLVFDDEDIMSEDEDDDHEEVDPPHPVYDSS